METAVLDSRAKGNSAGRRVWPEHTWERLMDAYERNGLMEKPQLMSRKSRWEEQSWHGGFSEQGAPCAVALRTRHSPPVPG